MILEWIQRLANAKENGRLQKVWTERMVALQDDYEAYSRSAELWEQQLKDEEKDVEKLKSRTFINLLYDLLDKKQEKLAAEEEEVIKAQLKYEEAIHAKENVQQHILELQVKLHSVRFWDIEVEEFTKKIEAYIHANDSDKSKQLRVLVQRQAECELQSKEFQEAIAAGRTVADHLQLVLENLRSARNWGTYDMLGGGLLSTHIKNGKIDAAMTHIRNAQHSLSRFEKELRHVRVTLSTDINISGFLRFSDYFFDGLITDWLVQDKIQAMLEQVEEKLREVNRLRNEMEQEDRKIVAIINNCKSSYTAIIENHS
ncbi:hypothetical protein ACFQZT_23250 [Paenibacillus sp. GCM10027628]|uniref:hypothetical protein n=1 Tax=Paenibacillus sp. GCM10027628 TaxID=3273413 RepID=UPI0036450561